MWCAHQWHTRLQDCKPTFLFSSHLHETCYKWPIFYHKHCTQNEFGWICDTSIPTLLALSNNTWQSRRRCVYIPDVSSVSHSAYAPLSSPQYLTKKNQSHSIDILLVSFIADQLFSLSSRSQKLSEGSQGSPLTATCANWRRTEQNQNKEQSGPWDWTRMQLYIWKSAVKINKTDPSW